VATAIAGTAAVVGVLAAVVAGAIAAAIAGDAAAELVVARAAPATPAADAPSATGAATTLEPFAVGAAARLPGAAGAAPLGADAVVTLAFGGVAVATVELLARVGAGPTAAAPAADDAAVEPDPFEKTGAVATVELFATAGVGATDGGPAGEGTVVTPVEIAGAPRAAALFGVAGVAGVAGDDGAMT